MGAVQPVLLVEFIEVIQAPDTLLFLFHEHFSKITKQVPEYVVKK